MERDQQIGILILTGSILGVILYGWLLFLVNALVVLQITAFVAVAVLLGILAWIGYTMATTPPPQPIDEKEIEKEIQAEEKPQEEKSSTSS
ncbi:MAG: hypothetical protein QXX95_05590 [Nitrososphaerales archaeon]